MVTIKNQMNKIKFIDLIKYEEILVKLLNKYNVQFNKNSRLFKYFNNLKEIEIARVKNKTLNALLESDKAKYYFSQYYVSTISDIISVLDTVTLPDEILKDKLSNLLKGSYLLSEENPENTIARDTTFELELFSFLHKLKTTVSMDNSNPDIVIRTENFVYNVECKRPASNNSIEKNIRKAAKQLRKQRVSSGIPTIALSLDRVLIGDDLIYQSKNHKTALSGLNIMLSRYSEYLHPTIQKVCANSPHVFLIYLSCLCSFKEELPMSVAKYMIGNIYNFEKVLSTKIKEDLDQFTGQS